MKLVCQTSCNNEHFDACDFAVIDLTPEMVERIKRRIAQFERAKAEDANLTTMEFYDCSAIFFDTDGSDLGDELQEEVWGNGKDWLPITHEIPESWHQRTDCDRLVISHYGDFWFQCCPKHSEWTVSTQTMTVSEMEAEMDIDAECPREAAEQAFHYMQLPGTTTKGGAA